MAEARGDKGSSKKILSFATKKARRVQQKVKALELSLHAFQVYCSTRINVI